MAVAILVTSYVYYQNYEKNYKLEVDRQITAISDLKVNQLVDWNNERMGDAGTFYHSPLFSSRVRHFFDDTNDTETHGEIQSWLEKELSNGQYTWIYLMDTGGEVRLSVPPRQRPVSETVSSQLPQILRSENVTILDFYRDEYDRQIYLAMVVPIYDDQDWGQPLGFLVFQMDPQDYLYPFIKEWPGQSASAETLLVRREGNDVVYLNDLRFINTSALNMRFPLNRTDIPAVKAVLGEEGIVEGTDYRGVPVVAATRRVPGTPWFLVSRMDTSEVYGPLREQFAILVFIVSLLLVGIGAAIGMVWRGESTRFYREKYESEKILQKEREKVRSYLEIVGTTVLAIGADEVVIMVNPAGCQLLGRHEEDILGKNWFDTFLPEAERETGREKFQQMIRGVIGPQELDEKVVVTASGEERIVAWHSTLLLDDDRHITGMLRSGDDITDLTRAEKKLERQNEELQAANEELTATEEELKSQFDELVGIQKDLWKSEERYRVTLDATNEGIWDWNVPYGTAYFSPHWFTMLGYEPGELPGSYTTWRTLVHPEDLPAVEKKILASFSRNDGYSVEFRMLTKQGDWKWIRSRGRVIERDSEGNPFRIVGTHTDITERKTVEGTLMRVNQKLNVLSQLTRKDLTNQIFILSGYLEMAKKYAAGQDVIIDCIKKCRTAAGAISEITDISRDYQDMGAYPPQWQNVKMVVLLGLSHITAGEIRHSLETEQLEIFADPLLEKVFQGLLENSIAHGRHVTRIRVSYSISHDGAVITFEDDGIGVPPDQKDRIFSRSEGLRTTVRGLFFVREILDITAITIRETGEPGTGARFEIVVPKGFWRIGSKKE